MMRRPLSSVTNDGSTNYSTVTNSLTTDQDATCTTSTMETVEWGSKLETTLEPPPEKDNTINESDSKPTTNSTSSLQQESKIKNERKPRRIPHTEKEALIAKGVVRRLTDYPTLDDVASDWGTEEEEIQSDRSKSKTKNEGKKMKR